MNVTGREVPAVLPSARSRWRMVVLVVVPPVVWFAHLNLTYLFVPWACDDGTRLLLHLTTLVAAALTTAALVVGALARTIRRPEDPWASTAALWGGLVFGALFLAAIVFNGIANIVIDPCT
jgi:hypothetical protein